MYHLGAKELFGCSLKELQPMAPCGHKYQCQGSSGLLLGLSLPSTFVGDMDSGTECTLSKSANNNHHFMILRENST